MEHELQTRVRYQDCDPMGVLHHANYFTYFEMGRTEMLRASGGNYRKMEEDGTFVVVVRAECRYQRPAKYDDVVCIHTKVTKIGAAKIEHEYRLLRGDELLATGQVVLAILDREGRVQPVPHWLQT